MLLPPRISTNEWGAKRPLASLRTAAPSSRLALLWALCAAAPLACGDDPAASEGDGGTGAGTSSTDAATSTDPTTGLPSATAVDTFGDSGTDDESTGDEPTGGVEPVEPLVWQTDCQINSYDLRRLHPDLECSTIEVPLDGDAPEGQQIVVGAVRIPAATEERVGTFWALDGGPGGSGLGYPFDEGWREEIRQAGWDIIIPPHRGTFSPRLDCNAFDYQSSECREDLEAEWGDGLQHFNTVEAARDVGAFIRRERRSDDEPVVVYGLSYGTYWAQFYSAQNPDQADAIILDSAVPMDGDLALEEYLVQEVAVQLLQTCVDDPVCGARVGFESGEAFSAAVIEAIDDGDCGGADMGLWEDSNLRVRFGQLLNSRGVRNYIPLLAAMLSRCDPALGNTASSAINGLLGTVGANLRPAEPYPIGRGLVSDDGPVTDGTPPAFELLFSGSLQSVVLATTMLAPDATPGMAELDAMNHFASINFGTLMAVVHDNWGDLPKVEFDRDAVSETPMLVLNAHYDVQTVFPWAELVAAQHGAPLVEFADGQHGVTLSQTGGKSLEGESCARAIMLAFMDDPQAPIDDDCAGSLPAIDVNISRADLEATSIAAFGTDDPWSLLPPL